MNQTFQHIYRIVILTLVFVILLIGCKKEVTRKADWETHFTDLHFADAKHGWIVGKKGFIVHTRDGGKTWKRGEVETEGDFKSVYFTNPKYGWAVGDQGLVATTDDGGRHWTLQKTNSVAMLRDVFFANSKEGWIVGEDGGVVLYTKNGGKTWKRHLVMIDEFPNEYSLNGVWFADDKHGWMVGE